MKHNKLLTATRRAGGLLLLVTGAVALQAGTDTPTNNSPRTTPGYDSNKTTTNSSTMSPVSKDSGYNAELARGDHKVLQNLAKLGEEELALSRIAADRAANPQVRAFAADMVREHTSANSEIAALAQSKGASLAADLGDKQQKINEKWTDKPAGGFDEDYLDAVISNHKKTIDELEDAADSKDPEVMALAAKLLPTVRAHLAHAQNLEKAVD